MTVQTFVTMLLILMTINAMVTQAMKKMLDEKHASYSSNVLALCDAVAVGLIGMICYYVIGGVAIHSTEIVLVFLMIVAVWLSSMYGYDKVVQIIKQTGSLK